MKLCINCMWRRGEYCRAPQNLTVDPVTGDQKPKWLATCERHRLGRCSGWFSCRTEGTCGREGRWFVPADAAEKGGAA